MANDYRPCDIDLMKVVRELPRESVSYLVFVARWMIETNCQSLEDMPAEVMR